LHGKLKVVKMRKFHLMHAPQENAL